MVSHSEKNHAADPLVTNTVAATNANTGLLMPNNKLRDALVAPCDLLFAGDIIWCSMVIVGGGPMADDDDAVVVEVGETSIWSPLRCLLVGEGVDGLSSSSTMVDVGQYNAQQ